MQVGAPKKHLLPTERETPMPDQTLTPIKIVDETCIGEHYVDLGEDGSIRIVDRPGHFNTGGEECVNLSDGEVAALKDYLTRL